MACRELQGWAAWCGQSPANNQVHKLRQVSQQARMGKGRDPSGSGWNPAHSTGDYYLSVTNAQGPSNRRVCVRVCGWVCSQSCPTLCEPTDCSLPGSSVHGILQAGILEWVAISFSRGTS